jgi:hypothetical protein
MERTTERPAPRWLRSKTRLMVFYWAVQSVAAYFFALASVGLWGDTDDVVMWFVPFMVMALILMLQWLFLWPVRRPGGSPKGLPIMVSLAVGGLFISLLITGFVLAVGAVLKAYDLIKLRDGLLFLVVLAAVWVISTPLLIAFCRRGPCETILQRVASGIFLGTIVEAAALIPLDALIRRREDCICETGTYIALIVCGSVGVIAFGPAILLPLVAQHRKRWSGRQCDVCGYDMSGNMSADRCPECGAGWRANTTD